MENFLKVLVAIFGVIGVIILMIVVMPFIHFWLAYFGGWIAMHVIGNPLTNALNTLFNTTYFHKEMLPMMAGALGWIGGFFKSVTSTTKKND